MDSASMTVLDNENLNDGDAARQRLENAGVLTNAGSVSISGTLPTNLVVSLLSSTPASSRSTGRNDFGRTDGRDVRSHAGR